MSIVKFKNFSYLKGPKGDKGDKGDPGRGVNGTTGRITYVASTGIVGFDDEGLATESFVASATANLATQSYVTSLVSQIDFSDYTTQSDVTTAIDTAISNLIDSAPGVLDTLNEISQALDNNPDFLTVINESLTSKLSLAGGVLTGSLTLNADPVNDLEAATKHYVDAELADVVAGLVSTTDDITEGTNQYFTNARARSAISVSGSLNYDSQTGVISYTAPTTISGNAATATKLETPRNISGIAFDGTNDITLSTSGIGEGTNLYYTDARAINAARSAISVDGAGSYDSATGVITVTGGVTSVNTQTGAVVLTSSDISEGTNLYYTDSRARLAITAGTNINYDSATGIISSTSAVESVNGQTGTVVLTTDDVSEATNQYYTDTRARSSISVSGDLSYDPLTGVISYTAPVIDLTGSWDDISVDGGTYDSDISADYENSEIVVGDSTFDSQAGIVLPVFASINDRDLALPTPTAGTMVLTSGSVEVYNGITWLVLITNQDGGGF